MLEQTSRDNFPACPGFFCPLCSPPFRAEVAAIRECAECGDRASSTGMLGLLLMAAHSPGLHCHSQSMRSPPGIRASSARQLLVATTSANRCLPGAHMSLRDRGRDNEVRHRSKVVKERSSSHAARSARSQPLPGQTPRSADGPDRRRAGFGKRLASRSASSRRKGRQRMGRAPPHAVRRPPSGFRRADDLDRPYSHSIQPYPVTDA